MGRSPTGSNDFGKTVVYGLRRVPLPPTKINALMTVYPQNNRIKIISDKRVYGLFS